MGNCGTCRFMAAERDLRVVERDDPADPNRVIYEDVERQLRTCTRIIHGNAETNDYEGTPEQPAMVVDGSGYAARLMVLPTFGCVLHESALHKRPDTEGSTDK
jgi:hypothetical protein